LIFDDILLDDIDEELDMAENYTPLPYFLTIKESSIEGLGLFAKENIDRGVDLGVSHVHHHKFLNGYIRTALGGFVNHSEEPNCKLVDYKTEMHLYTTELIKAGEELTLKYKLYDPVEIIDER
jgi:SET domain-containing protein|tara:strand:- start:330 stop:698 length:369 start_codon:yes stop_codon:yes gene_type:complete